MLTRSKPGSAEIAATLKRAILSGDLIRSDRLPAERIMAEQYGVSRGTVREALRRLETEEFIDIRAGSGAYVIWADMRPAALPIESARPLELMDARFALEPHMCRLAVLHARRADFDKMEELMQRMEAAPADPVDFAEADSEWHAALAQSTGNNLLIGILGQINSVRGLDEWTRMRRLTLNEPTIAKYNAQHRQILNAIRAREPERAAVLMKEHLEHARLTLTRAAAT